MCIHAEKDRSPSYPSFAPTPVILNHGNHGFSHAILLGEIYECGDMLVACLGEVLVAADCDLGVTTDHATPHGFRVTNERWKRGACVSFTFVEKVAIARSWGPVFLRPPIDTDDRALTFALRGSSLPQSSPQVNALWRQRTDQWGFILQHNYSGMWKATCTCTRASWSEVANVTPPSPPPPPSPQAELVPSTNEPRAAPDPQTSDFFAAPKHVSHAAVPAATQESPFPSTTPPQRSEFPASVMLEFASREREAWRKLVGCESPPEDPYTDAHLELLVAQLRSSNRRRRWDDVYTAWTGTGMGAGDLHAELAGEADATARVPSGCAAGMLLVSVFKGHVCCGAARTVRMNPDDPTAG